MSPSLTKALRPLLLIAASLLMLACSRIDLAYRNLDVLVPWSLGDYLDMNREQKNWLDQRLKQHLAWHCQTQLPGYLAWLDQIRRMVAEDDVTDQQLQQRTAEAREAIGRVTEEITPSAAELLRGMSDEQVREMREAFSEDIRERQAKYVDTPLARQIDRRAERMEKRLKPWLGELNAEQRVRVMAWSQALGEQNRQWIANRAHWQQQLSLAMDQRHGASFEPRLAQLLQQKERLWTPQYRAAFHNTEAQARSLLVDLMRQSSPAQRQFLQDRLSKVRADFSGMKCLKG
ncbi:MAG: lipoprotein [Pseudomonas sp.]|nr:lipoprotein [Pseudomonas sp.]